MLATVITLEETLGRGRLLPETIGVHEEEVSISVRRVWKVQLLNMLTEASGGMALALNPAYHLLFVQFASLRRLLNLLRLTSCLSLTQHNTWITPCRQLTSYIAYYTLASSIYPHRSSILTSQYTFTHRHDSLSCSITSIYRPPGINHQHSQN